MRDFINASELTPGELDELIAADTHEQWRVDADGNQWLCAKGRWPRIRGVSPDVPDVIFADVEDDGSIEWIFPEEDHDTDFIS
jgi:hypothetical protein